MDGSESNRSRAARAERAGRAAALAAVLLAPIAWLFRGVLEGQTYAQSWWYAFDPLFSAARDFSPPPRAVTIWDPSPSALNAVADRFAADSLAHFELPLWNPYHGLGMPLLAEVHPVVLSPLRWLVSFPLGGGDVGTTWLMIAQLSLAAAGAYGWLRACDRSRESAAVAAAAYPFVGGAIAALHFTTTAGTTALPFMLWTGERLVRRPSLAAAARYGLATAFGAFVTHPSVGFVCGVGAGLYVLVRALGGDAKTVRVLALAIVAAVITTCLASVLLLPFRELMEHGWTYKEVIRRDQVHTDVPIHFVLPPSASVTFFPAALVLVGALGLLARARERWALAITFFVALGLVYELPGTRMLVYIPFQELFGRAYIILVACAAATGLLAKGLDVLRDANAPRTRRTLALLPIAGGIAAVLVLRLGAHLPLETWTETQWTAPDGVRVLVAVVTGLGLLALAGASRATWRRAVPLWLYACLLLEILPRAATHIQPEPSFDFPETPALAFLRAHMQHGERLVSTGTWSRHTTLTAHVPNVGLVTHLDDPRSADPLFVGRTHTLLDPISAHSWYAIYFTDYPERRARSIGAHRATILEMLGVRYVLARTDTMAPIGHDVAYQDDSIVVYENRAAFERAFVVHELEVTPDVESARLRVDAVDLRRIVIVDGVDEPPLPPAPTVAPGVEVVHIAERSAQHIALDATLQAEGFVVLSDAYYPGWEATLDGAPVRILPANVAVRAVRVPAGQHHIEMRYRPTSFRLGARLAALALLIALALIARDWLRDRERIRAGSQPAGAKPP